MRVVFIFLISSNIVQVLTEEWIDPHDMNTNSKIHLRKSKESSNGDAVNTVNGDFSDNRNLEKKTTLVYLKRIISLILNSAVAGGADMKLRSGKYDFNIDSENYKFLSEFTTDQNVNDESLRKLDTILSDVFRRHVSDDIVDSLLSFQDELFYSFFNIKAALLLAVLLSLYIGYNLLKSEYTFWYIGRYFLMIILIVDYGYRYGLLYEEVEKHNMKIEYSSKCDPKAMDWGAYFHFLFNKEDCERKYVTPLEVALFQLKHIIIIPMSALGTGFGHFAKELWVTLPSPWNFFIFPIMLGFVLLLGAIIMATFKESYFQIKLPYLFHLQVGKQNDDTNRVAGPTLDKFLDAVGVHHRPMVENTQSSPDKRKKIKEKKKSSSSKSQDTLTGNNLEEVNISSNSNKTKIKDPCPKKCEKKNLNRTNDSGNENSTSS